MSTISRLRFSCLHNRSSLTNNGINLNSQCTFYGRAKSKQVLTNGTQLSDRVHLVDAEAIKYVIGAMSSDWSKEKTVIVDASPGPGLLLEALLKAGALKVRGLLHSSSPYRSVLQSLKETYPDRLALRDFDFLNFRSNFSMESMSDQIKDILGSTFDSEIAEWTDDPPIKLVLPLTPNVEKKVLRRLLIELTHQGGIYSFGRTQLFAFISEREYGYMRVLKDVKPALNQPSHILYKSFYHIDHLTSFNWDCLHPIINGQKSGKKDIGNVHLVSLVPKVKISDAISTKDWPDYFYFVKQTMPRRKNRIIPFMEKLVPDCGLRLIKTGIGVHQVFGELQPEEFIHLFSEIKKWPELEMSHLGNVTKDFLSPTESYIISEEFINKR